MAQGAGGGGGGGGVTASDVTRRATLGPLLRQLTIIVQELWTSWAVRPNEPSGFRGRKDLLNRASALVTACP